jgi:hypothetical protein
MGEFKKGRQEIEKEIRSAASEQEGIDPETGAEEASEPA